MRLVVQVECDQRVASKAGRDLLPKRDGAWSIRRALLTGGTKASRDFTVPVKVEDREHASTCNPVHNSRNIVLIVGCCYRILASPRLKPVLLAQRDSHRVHAPRVRRIETRFGDIASVRSIDVGIPIERPSGNAS
jgi:hypothetical protein